MKTVKNIFGLFLILLLIAAIAQGSPDEAYGRVTKVVDGDTFDVELQNHDDRISEDQIRIRLADIDCPETRGAKACEAGKNATAYARSWLLSSFVSLDLDDKTGKDPYSRWVAVVYLEDGRNFNKMLVDAGHAEIEDYKNNEFDPWSWWS